MFRSWFDDDKRILIVCVRPTLIPVGVDFMGYRFRSVLSRRLALPLPLQRGFDPLAEVSR